MTETIGNKVSELRQRFGATQEELAERVGVSRQTIIAVEKGNYTPSLLLALKLSLFFNKQIEYIFWLKK